MSQINRRTALAISLAACGWVWMQPAWADEYDDTIAMFKKAEETGKFFADAYGYAVFPKILKGAVGIGGARGTGRVYEKGKYVGDSTMTQLSIGFQLGGEGFAEMIFFENKAALRLVHFRLVRVRCRSIRRCPHGRRGREGRLHRRRGGCQCHQGQGLGRSRLSQGSSGLHHHPRRPDVRGVAGGAEVLVQEEGLIASAWR